MRQGAMMLGVAAMALAGCGDFLEGARQRQQQALAEQQRYRDSPDGQAAMTCETKVAFAMAASPIRGSLDVAGVVRQMQLQDACMQHWRRTGTFP